MFERRDAEQRQYGGGSCDGDSSGQRSTGLGLRGRVHVVPLVGPVPVTGPCHRSPKWATAQRSAACVRTGEIFSRPLGSGLLPLLSLDHRAALQPLRRGSSRVSGDTTAEVRQGRPRTRWSAIRWPSPNGMSRSGSAGALAKDLCLPSLRAGRNDDKVRWVATIPAPPILAGGGVLQHGFPLARWAVQSVVERITDAAAIALPAAAGQARQLGTAARGPSPHVARFAL